MLAVQTDLKTNTPLPLDRQCHCPKSAASSKVEAPRKLFKLDIKNPQPSMETLKKCVHTMVKGRTVSVCPVGKYRVYEFEV